MIETILIAGAGAPAAIGVIKSLRKASYKGKIITTDADPLSAGFFLADVGIVVPKITDAKYKEALFNIIEKHNVQLIYPTNGFEIQKCAEYKAEIEAKGVIVFMSDYKPLMTCIDKWKFHNACKDHFPMPKTSLNYKDLEFPIFAKKIRGKGSVGIKLCKTEEDVLTLENKEEYLFQEYLPGKEYTIDVLSDRNAKPLVAVARERVAIKAGISFKGRVVRDKQIETFCLEIAKHLKLKGPTCMQMKRRENGDPVFIEINPRLGGGTVFATLAGVNIPKMILDLAEGKQPHIPEPKPITVLRYYEEVIAES